MIKWVATFLVLWFIYAVREVFPPIIVGAILAYLLLPVVNALSAKTKLPIAASTAIVYCILATALGVAGWYFVPKAVHEVAELVRQRDEIVGTVIGQIANATQWNIDQKEVTNQLLTGINDAVANAQGLADVGKSISHGALFVLVCVVSSIYLTLDSQSVGKFFLRYLPENRRAEAVVLANRMNRLLSRYVQGQLFLIVLMSTVAWLFLHFGLQMKYALPVAILSGCLEIIPVLGPILAISTAVIVGMWQMGPSCAPLIIGFYTIARWIEDYVVIPKVIGHAVELHPLAVIFAVLCGERLAGGLGMLIAIPVAACVKLFIDFFYFGTESQQEHAEDASPQENKEPSGPAAEALKKITESRATIAEQEKTMIDPERVLSPGGVEPKK